MGSSKQNEKLVLEYLKKQNRPIGLQSLVSNFSGQIGKTALVKTLDELVDEKRIKAYDGQKVYMNLQSVDVSKYKSNLRDLDEKLMLVNSDLNRMKSENSKLEANMASIENKVPIPELQKRIQEESEEVKHLKIQIKNAKALDVKVLTKEEKQKIQKKYESYVKLWRRNKRIAREIIDVVLENSEMKKRELCEDVGVILDEDLKIEPPKI